MCTFEMCFTLAWKPIWSSSLAFATLSALKKADGVNVVSVLTRPGFGNIRVSHNTPSVLKISTQTQTIFLLYPLAHNTIALVSVNFSRSSVCQQLIILCYKKSLLRVSAKPFIFWEMQFSSSILLYKSVVACQDHFCKPWIPLNQVSEVLIFLTGVVLLSLSHNIRYCE